MRNDKLIRVGFNLAKKAREDFDNGKVFEAKIYASIAYDFLKLANAEPSDYQKLSELLPDFDNASASEEMMTVGRYQNGRWYVW